MLIHEDCLSAMKRLSDNSVDMVYMDPPFFTQKTHTLSNASGIRYEFSDVWNSREEYLKFIKERLIECKRVMNAKASIFLHCDTAASHHLRVLLDDVFGESNFRSEIIWTYKRWSNSKKGLLPGHQTIFFYSKTKDYIFNTFYGDYSPTTNLDQILQARERDARGKAKYKYDSNGSIVLGKEKKGVPLSDVWEIPFLNPKAKERTGYPTQKPIELLEKIIKISTSEGATVLDPFCGSGTTLVAAHLLNRRYIGIDINPDAITLSEKRLEMPFKTESTLLKVGSGAYQTKSQRELSILQQFDCDIVQRNKGIDAFLKKYYLGKPVALRIQKEHESFEDALALLSNAGKKKGCSFLVLITQHLTPYMQNILPDNMIVLPSLECVLNDEIEQQLGNL
ncbi:DNA-methyltransferase [Phascolarctobacterium succinatutens]|uniref:DNA-methyltransferase n=1 Tax=Phascolarctobacterium succinatutens TaxID=626940 RepID=UPI0026F354ED|nr:site-specific DNA-methyltransferase [Phascolarctobacterium succinatutens]